MAKTKLVISKTKDFFEEVRCHKCKSLLYKVRHPEKGASIIEVKCRKCGTINTQGENI